MLALKTKKMINEVSTSVANPDERTAPVMGVVLGVVSAGSAVRAAPCPPVEIVT